MSESESITILFIMLSFAAPLVFILLGFVVGGFLEKSHFKKLALREEKLAFLVATNLKTVPPGKEVRAMHLVKGDVVISSDYFKSLIAGLKHLFGGRLYSMETLLKPFEMTARYCQMEWLPPLVVHDVRPPQEGGLSDEALAAQAAEYKKLLESL